MKFIERHKKLKAVSHIRIKMARPIKKDSILYTTKI